MIRVHDRRKLAIPLLERDLLHAVAAEAAAELDPERRRALYHHILATLRADVPALWLAQLDDLYAARPGLDWQPRADSLLWLYDAMLWR